MGRFGYHVIDADGHVFEPPEMYEQFCDRYLDAPYRSELRQMIDEERDIAPGSARPLWARRSSVPVMELGRQLGVLDQAERPTRPGWKPGAKETLERWNPEGRLEDMDIEGIDVAVIFPSGMSSFCALEDRGFEVAMYQAYHRAIGDYCGVAPDRLKYVGLVSMRDIEAGVAEVRRAAADPNMVGVCVSAHMEDKLLDYPGFYPIWEEAVSLDLPIVIHGQGSGRPPYSLGNWDMNGSLYLVHCSTHPYEQTRAMASLAGGGVLQKFPKLRFAFLEAGCGWVPYWVDRMEEHWEQMPAHVPFLTENPRSLVQGRDQCFISCDSDETTLEYVVELLGEDRIVYASDYPHFDGRFPDSVRFIAERDRLPESAKKKILGENARRLYTRIG